MMNYVIEGLDDVQSVWDNLKDKARNKIRKAQKSGVTVEMRDDFDTFYQLFRQTIDRIGFETGASEQVLRQLHTEIQRQNVGKIFFAVDNLGIIHAALYVIWNKTTALYWVHGLAAPSLHTARPWSAWSAPSAWSSACHPPPSAL